MYLLLLFLGCAPEDTDKPGDTDTGEPDAETALLPPDWLDAWPTTVPTDQGWQWERDEDFAIPDVSVPQTFVGHDGRYGMLLTDNGHENWRARSVIWSDDGLTWSDPEVLADAADFNDNCGERIEDGTLLHRAAGEQAFLFEGTWDQGLSRALCVAHVESDGTLTFDPEPVFEGFDEGVVVSVPAVLRFEDEAVLWYNNLNPDADTDPGVHLAYVDPASFSFSPMHEGPISKPDRVDPMPVYEEGGGVRLYFTKLGNPAPGIYAVALTDELLFAEEDGTQIVPSPGRPREGEDYAYYMDPAFLRLDDGTLVLYATLGTYYSTGEFYPEVQRFIAVD